MHPWARWNGERERRYTLGVEEELMLLERGSSSLAQSSDRVLPRLSDELALRASPESRLGVPHPFQGTIATTDGESTWAVRYSSEGKSRSLYYTTDVPTLRQLYPDRQLLRELSDDARLIVSEPLGDVAGVWNEVPEATYAIVGPDHDDMRPLHPRAPSKSVPVVA